MTLVLKAHKELDVQCRTQAQAAGMESSWDGEQLGWRAAGMESSWDGEQLGWRAAGMESSWDGEQLGWRLTTVADVAYPLITSRLIGVFQQQLVTSQSLM